jgi:8-oxo-dGTP pyrophosphatase MutT (NUDIX family)
MALPPEIAGHLNLDGPPVEPRPAATVLVVREGDPWELLMVHRPGGADFAPGAYVFPGGAVHKEDRAWPDEIAGAAVRETFEETGILLARNGKRFAEDAELAGLRAAIEQGASFPEAMDGQGLEPAFDELVVFARWVTPAQLRRRFDTRFFLARLPSGQTIRPQAGEVTDWRWVSPRSALDTDDITLVYATRVVLESVVSDPDVDALFARAHALQEIPVVEPRIVNKAGSWTIES